MYTNVQLGLAIAAAESQEMRVVMPYKMMLCVAITSENIETGWFNLKKLNPIVLDTATGIGWNLEVRRQFTLKEMNALVAGKVFSRSLVLKLESVSVID